jgi:translation initiation factor 6
LLEKLDIDGNPYLGVFCKCNEKYVIFSNWVKKSIAHRIADALCVEKINLTISGSSIIGSLLCMNTYGAVVTNFAGETEIAKLKQIVDNVYVIDDRLNAVGNNILATDKGAVVHPGFTKKSINRIRDTLGVEVLPATIADFKTVGMAAIATNKGILCHHYAKEEELKLLSDIFKTPVNIGTLNFGVPLVGACTIANTKGAVVGSRTTAIELGRIEDALNLF